VSATDGGWSNAWQACQAAFGALSNARPDATWHAIADGYADFARAIAALLAAQPNLAPNRVVAAACARLASGNALASDAALNAFLRGAPQALGACMPHANLLLASRQLAETRRAWLDQVASVPALGPQREWQLRISRLLRVAHALERMSEGLHEHYRAAYRNALERFARSLQDDSGAPITSLRGLYDAWVVEAESAYAEHVMRPVFAQDFAQWVNAGSELKLALREFGGALAALSDAPSRVEIDVLLARQRELEARVATLVRERAQTVVAEAAKVEKPARTTSAKRTRTPLAKSRAPVKPRNGARDHGGRGSAREFDIAQLLVRDQ